MSLLNKILHKDESASASADAKAMADKKAAADKPEAKKKEVAKKAASNKEDTKNAYKVLVKPLISEKATELGKLNQYIFAVNEDTNKQEVKKAIASVYGITPVKVNIIKQKGKKVRFGRTYGKRKDWKKAIITLPKGQSIEVYEGT